MCGVLSLLLSAVSRTLLEDKARFSPWLVARPLATLTLAGVVTAVSVSTGALWRESAQLASVSTAQTRFSQARDDNPVVYADGCHLNYEEVTSPECVFGDTSSSMSIVLFGDSHAAQWFPALERVATTEGFRLVSLTKSGCPSVDVALRDLRLGRRYTECEAWRHNALARIKAMKPSLIVLANASDYVDPVRAWVLRRNSRQRTVQRGAHCPNVDRLARGPATNTARVLATRPSYSDSERLTSPRFRRTDLPGEARLATVVIRRLSLSSGSGSSSRHRQGRGDRRGHWWTHVDHRHVISHLRQRRV